MVIVPTISCVRLHSVHMVYLLHPILHLRASARLCGNRAPQGSPAVAVSIRRSIDETPPASSRPACAMILYRDTTKKLLHLSKPDSPRDKA